MFWYSGLASTASRVRRSGACRRMSSSHPALVSSIATWRSPRAPTSAAASTSGSIRVGAFPRASSPSAEASRRAGSTVSTSVRRAWRWTAATPSAAATVVLPTPPEPATRIISRLASSASRSRVERRDRLTVRPRSRRRVRRRPGRPHVARGSVRTSRAPTRSASRSAAGRSGRRARCGVGRGVRHRPNGAPR